MIFFFRYSDWKGYRRATSSSRPSSCLYKSLAVSILLYGCESPGWCREKDPGVRDPILRKHLRISYWKQKANNYVGSKVRSLVRQQESLLATTKCRLMSWFEQLTRHNSFCNTIMQGKADASGDGNSRFGQISKTGWIWQCWNSWDPSPIDHPGGGCVFLQHFGSHGGLKKSREWWW